VKMMKRKEKSTEELAEGVKEAIENPELLKPHEVDASKVVSTGSTLLDLAVFGGRKRGGGIPGGIIVEIFGPSGAGKTAILSEICASVQAKGGRARFLDPEARLDQEYARIYGMALSKEDYARPDTVTEVFDEIWSWEPSEEEGLIHVVGCDSLAALSTKLELEKTDKMGMRRAKEFSEGLRKTCRIIRNNNWLIACTNQVREGDSGEVTPGGKSIPFYSSLRIRVAPIWSGSMIERETTFEGKKVKKIIGVKSTCYIKKSIIDDPYREATIYIVFGVGVDDIRGNLCYLKDMTKSTKYDCVDAEYGRIETATHFIEKNNLEGALREKVIDLWERVEEKFKVDRKPKVRF